MADDNLLKLTDVMRISRLSKASVYRLMNDGKFPLPLRVGVRLVAWEPADVIEWRRTRDRVTYDKRGA